MILVRCDIGSFDVCDLDGRPGAKVFFVRHHNSLVEAKEQAASTASQKQWIDNPNRPALRREITVV